MNLVLVVMPLLRKGPIAVDGQVPRIWTEETLDNHPPAIWKLRWFFALDLNSHPTHMQLAAQSYACHFSTHIVPARFQLLACAKGQGRVHFLPYCKISLKADKPVPYPKDPKTVGDHLRYHRYARGLFQSDVAKVLSVTESTVCDWENNKSTPAVRYFPKIIQFLGYDPLGAPTCLGEEVAAKRRLEGLSRKRVAKAIGMDEMTLAKIERGTREPTKRDRTNIHIFLSD